jgi:hypothetical protein
MSSCDDRNADRDKRSRGRVSGAAVALSAIAFSAGVDVLHLTICTSPIATMLQLLHLTPTAYLSQPSGLGSFRPRYCWVLKMCLI